MSPFIICCRQFICLQVSGILLLGIFHPKIGDFLALFRQIPLNLHAKIQKNIQKVDDMDGFCLQGKLDLTLFYKIEGC